MGGAHEILQAYRERATAALTEMTSIARFLHPPPLPDVPEALRDRRVITLGACWVGEEREGAELIAPLRKLAEPIMDTFGPIPSARLVTIHMDPEHPVPGAGHHALVRELTEEAVDAFVQAAGPGSGSPLLVAELRHLGGAPDAPGEDGGALPCIEAAFVLNAIGALMDPAEAKPIARYLDQVCDSVAAWSTGGHYLNLAESRADCSALFPLESDRRLGELKARWDPRACSAPTTLSARPDHGRDPHPIAPKK